MNITNEILKVIDLEKKAIEILRENIGPEYKKAVELIFRCKGKIVVTGVGKSGLIAQKIASTFASTGTLAVYMHPADAMHGDLGIVKSNDIVIAIGKSGESSELVAILPAIKKIGAKIIAVTASKSSTMSKYVDIVLNTKIDREACPLDLAPTSSTTAALVIGDALAVVLMKLRGFTSRDFALFHPGGRLGKRLTLTVAEIMRSGEQNPVVRIDDSTRNMLCIITEKMAGAVSVVDKKGRLKGLVADYDIRRNIEQGKDILKMRISEIMNPDPLYISKDTKAIKALEIMERRDKPISLLPVVDKNKEVVGMLNIHDILSRGL